MILQLLFFIYENGTECFCYLLNQFHLNLAGIPTAYRRQGAVQILTLLGEYVIWVTPI
jgi:hypothetical protein